jgi:hypothetical protein
MDPKTYAPHFHDLKRFAKSPLHYLTGLGVDGPDSAAFRFGRLTHAVTLGVGEINIFEGKTRQGKAWEEFASKHDERTIYKKDEVEEAKRIADAVHNDPLARDLLVGRFEVPAEWTMNGRKVATRGIDILGSSFICDLKTTSNAEPHTFQRGGLRYGYHAQLAMYLDAARTLGSKASEAYVIAVETAPPYAVTVHHLSPRLLEEGRKLVRSWMERLRACEEADEWPSYTQCIVEWDIVEDSFGLIIDGEEVAA